jgi:hypothetical protein
MSALDPVASARSYTHLTASLRWRRCPRCPPPPLAEASVQAASGDDEGESRHRLASPSQGDRSGLAGGVRASDRRGPRLGLRSLDARSAYYGLGVVIDLILLRTDSQRAQFIEIIDYKTGKHLDASLFALVLSRFVLKRLINTHLPGESFAPVIFTELYPGKRHVRTNEMTLERCLADGEEVKRTLAGIAAETSWAPTPSPLCEWCPINGNGCEPTSKEDSMSLW